MAGKGDKLTSEQQTFVVQQLAMWDSPETVAKAVREEFGVTITRQAIECYDPTKRAGAKLAEKWKALFEETRSAFIENTAEIGISHRAVRLRALQRMQNKAEQQGNLALAKDILKQAAEEVGGALTNRRELTGRDGKDLPAPGAVTIFALPDNGRG